MVALEWFTFGVGAVLAVAMTVDLFLTLVVPRPRRSPVGRGVERVVATATMRVADLTAPRRGGRTPAHGTRPWTGSSPSVPR